jgi:hypothetical protein
MLLLALYRPYVCIEWYLYVYTAADSGGNTPPLGL